MRIGLAGLALGGALLGAVAPVAAAEAQLVFFHPFRPGVLAQCRPVQGQEGLTPGAWPDPADPRKGWVVGQAFSLHWPGGVWTQMAPSQALAGHPPTDLCFAVWRDGQLLVSGAVVAEASARRLSFNTLVRMRSGPGEPLRFELRPRFPGEPADPAPPEWSVLKALP